MRSTGSTSSLLSNGTGRPWSPRRWSPLRRGPECADRRPARGRPPILERRPRLVDPDRGGASARPTGTSPAGWPLPRPAMSGAEPWTGSKTPGRRVAQRRAGQQADRAREHRRLVAEDVAEHVLGEDDVEVARGWPSSCIAALSTSTCSSSTCGNSSSWTRWTTSRHRREVSSTLALSTLDTRDCAAPKRRAGDPLDLLDGVRADVVGAAVGAALVAEVDAAGQLAHDEQVGALDALAPQRARVVERGQRADGTQVRVQAQALAQAEQPLLGPRRGGIGGVPLRPADGGQQHRVGPAARRERRRRSARCRARRSRRPPKHVLLEREVAEPAEQLDRRRHDLGADPVAGQGDDALAGTALAEARGSRSRWNFSVPSASSRSVEAVRPRVGELLAQVADAVAQRLAEEPQRAEDRRAPGPWR